MFAKLRLKKYNQQNTPVFTIKGTFYCKIVDTVSGNMYRIIMSPFGNSQHFQFTVYLKQIKCPSHDRDICETIRFKTFNKILQINATGIDAHGCVLGEIITEDGPLSKWMVDNDYAKYADDMSSWT